MVGISYRQLDHWDRTGLVHPSLVPARGSGTRRRYSYHDILEVKVIKQLLDFGVKLQRARQAVVCLREDFGGDLASASLVLAGSDSILVRDRDELFDLIRRGQGVFTVALSGVLEELDAEIVGIRGVGSDAPSQTPRAVGE